MDNTLIIPSEWKWQSEVALLQGRDKKLELAVEDYIFRLLECRQGLASKAQCNSLREAGMLRCKGKP